MRPCPSALFCVCWACCRLANLPHFKGKRGNRRGARQAGGLLTVFPADFLSRKSSFSTSSNFCVISRLADCPRSSGKRGKHCANLNEQLLVKILKSRSAPIMEIQITYMGRVASGRALSLKKPRATRSRTAGPDCLSRKCSFSVFLRNRTRHTCFWK